MHTISLGIALGGTTGRVITQPSIPMYDADGEPNEHNVATHVALGACSVSIPDVYEADGFDFSGTRTFDARNGYRSKSCLAVPLIDNTNSVIGVLQLINAQDRQAAEIIAFDAYAQQVVESLASLAAVAISNRRLIEHQQKLLKYERDVQIGRQIQSDFLPHQLPRLQNWEIATRFRPAREVSGDFYDVFELPGERHVGLVIADISDKGVPAALFMALIRSLLRAFSEIPVPPSLLGLAERYAVSSTVTSDVKLATVLTHLNAVNAVLLTNNYVVRNHSEVNMFATLFCGVLDTETGLLTYVNCGHEPLLILADNGIQTRLEPTGPAVGLFEDMSLDIERSILEPGDLLFGYTDGVTDARSPEGKFFSAKALLALMERCCEPQPQLTAEEVLGHVESALIDHIGAADQFDDITMLAIRRGATGLAASIADGS
jgi:sigma-B regulation protein RsbU (phosphoserine phosphatase)